MFPSRHGLRLSAALFVCGCLLVSYVSAQPDEPKQKLFVLPKVLANDLTPATPQELRQIEEHVKKVIDKVMPAIVCVRVGPGQGSGVIVKEDGTLLTAGHVSGKPEQVATIIFPNAVTKKGKTLGQNKGIDSGMCKISDEGKYPFLEMGKSSDLKAGQWVIAIGHPGGFRPNRTPVVRVGRILVADPKYIRTDCALVGGDSGGPLFDMQGRVIGIHSRIGPTQMSENVHVPIDTYLDTWDKLVKGDSWGDLFGREATVRSAGGKSVFEKKDALTKQDETEPCPKDAALKSFRKVYTFRMKAGHTYTVDLISSDKSGVKLDTFLRLENDKGKEIAKDDDGAGFPNARIVHKAIKDADYKIIATTFEPNQIGAFTLKILDADFVDAIVSGKADVLKSIKLPGLVIQKALDDSKKVKLQLHFNALLVDPKGDPIADKELVVQWDNGTQTYKSDKAGIVRWAINKDNVRKLTVQTPKDVRAMIALTDDKGVSIGLALKDDPSLEKVKSAGGKVIRTFEGKIAKTDPFDAEREKCFRHVHEVKLQPGKTYTLDLVSEDFDAYLRIESDDKGKIAEDDDSGGWLNSRIVFSPESAGAYRVVVTTCDPGQLGAYVLTIRETDGAVKKENKKGSK